MNSNGLSALTAVTSAMIDEKMLLEGEEENEYLLMESCRGLKTQGDPSFQIQGWMHSKQKVQYNGPIAELWIRKIHRLCCHRDHGGLSGDVIPVSAPINIPQNRAGVHESSLQECCDNNCLTY